MVYEFFNRWHLGDCLFQCLYLQRVAPLKPEDTFLFYCQNHEQLYETIAHVPNVELVAMEPIPPSAIDCWIGAEAYWHKSPIRNNYLQFYLDWFEQISKRAKLPNPFKAKEDFWWDFPALNKPTALSRPFDFLVVNAPPKSGQFQYDPKELDDLIAAIVRKGHTVVATNPTSVPGVECTQTHGLTVTGIGNVSNFCTRHLMISTGPSWLTFNTTNRRFVKLRLILLNGITLDYDPTCVHFNYVQGAANYLKSQNLI